jgi:hypothetical protein
MRSAKKHIRPVDMMTIYRAHRSIWGVLNQGKRVVDPNEARELSDKVIRKLVEVAREGVIDIDTLRERTLAALPDHKQSRSGAICPNGRFGTRNVRQR